ncbi:hypothetical protein QR680_004824 [Steinernema hermaphroditum]|uniref:Uncharacterized protein n=1 Tax=Steinernema hermaphroditum TaxID=289476 RepID=A0AA39HS62_9BILA|nr:hypothetical protein QR680_004824 [Steinernema hermaphroditum]
MLATPAFSIALDQNRRFGAKVAMYTTTDPSVLQSPERTLEEPCRLTELLPPPQEVPLLPRGLLRSRRDRRRPSHGILHPRAPFGLLDGQNTFSLRNSPLRMERYLQCREMFDYPDRYSWPTTVSNQMVYTGAFCTEVGRVPEDLEAFMSDSTKKGLIYVAFGSMVNWAWAPPHLDEREREEEERNV